MASITVHVHKPLLRQQLKVKLYITCLQVVYSKYRPLCIVTVQVYKYSVCIGCIVYRYTSGHTIQI